MKTFGFFSAALGLSHAFSIPSQNGMGINGLHVNSPDGQSVFDIDITINTAGSQHSELNRMGEVAGMEDMPVGTLATRAQYNRGVVAAVAGSPEDSSFTIVGVGADGGAWAHVLNSTWYPKYKEAYRLGGKFNRSLAAYYYNQRVYVAGVTQSRNLVVKSLFSNGSFYPGTRSWIQLEEDIADGTPAIASHDNKTLSIVVKRTDGTILHKIFDPNTDEYDAETITVPDKKFVSNPALLVRPGNKLQVFVTAANGEMYFSEWASGKKAWSTWTSLGGDFVGDPATKWLGAQGDIWSIGKNRNVYARYYTAEGCFSATWLEIGNTDALGTGDLHYWGPKFQYADFFFQTSGQMKWVRRDGDKLSLNALDGVIQAAPAAIDFWYKGTAYSDFFAIGMNNMLYRKQRLGETWQAWENLGGNWQ